MTHAATTPLFAVVFTLFVVAVAVLIVLTLRFVIGQARAYRAAWLDRRATGGTAPTTSPSRARR